MKSIFLWIRDYIYYFPLAIASWIYSILICLLIVLVFPLLIVISPRDYLRILFKIYGAIESIEIKFNPIKAKVKSDLTGMDDEQLRDYKTPWPKSIEELNETINAVVNRGHDYSTAVYAMSIAAEAAFNYVAGRLGVSGFQASCADLDFLNRTRRLKAFQIIDYSEVLYPQYHDKINSISVDSIIAENKDFFREECKKMLAEHESASPAVIKNWKEILEKCEEK